MRKLICASCRRRWTPEPDEKRTECCPNCRHRNLSSAITRAWDRRKRLGPRTVPVEEPGNTLAVPLDQLMREADAASAKALAAALAITRKE